MKIRDLLFVAFVIASLISSGQTISPMLLGQNFWFTDNTQNGINNGNDDLDVADWTVVEQSGARLIRIGGQGYNLSSAGPTDEVYWVSLMYFKKIQFCCGYYRGKRGACF